MPRLSSFRPVPAVFAAALAGILNIPPAAAQEGVGAPYAHNDWHDPGSDAPPSRSVPPVAATGPVVGVQAAPGEAIPGRAQWLAECRRRLADRDEWQREGRGHRGRAKQGPDECESYLDDYYANARAHHEHQMQAYAGPALVGRPMHMMPLNQDHAEGSAGHGANCCQGTPMLMTPSGPYMLVPVMVPARKANCQRNVIETIEEVVPARRAVPRRALPRDKRVRLAPDKTAPAQ